MLPSDRNAKREEAIQYFIDTRMEDEIKDFFDWLDDEVTLDEFEYKLQRHMLYTLICMQNKENIQEDIDQLWFNYLKFHTTDGEVFKCEICSGKYPEDRIIGCCNKPGCKIETLCRDCAEFDEELEEYICGDC
jgi:hypothetical protein